MASRLSSQERDRAAQIVATFSVLIHAWATNDFHEAARARDELGQLGGSSAIAPATAHGRGGANPVSTPQITSEQFEAVGDGELSDRAIDSLADLLIAIDDAEMEAKKEK